MQDEKTLEFLQRIKDSGQWNDEYDYSKVQFSGLSKKVIVIHKKFKTEHSVTPKYMLTGAKCSRLNVINTLTFNECKKYVHSLKLQSEKGWIELRRNDEIPYNIPGTPDKFFKRTGEWKGMGDWLGTGRVANYNIEFYEFEKCREIVRKLNFKNVEDWRKNSKDLDKRIPRVPTSTYKEKWISWNDFLGTNNVYSFNVREKYYSYEDAVKYLSSKKLNSLKEYEEFLSINNIDFLPKNPGQAYKKYYNDKYEYLSIPKIDFFNYHESKKYIQKQNLNSQGEFDEAKKNNTISERVPTNPWRFYKNQWEGYGVWLGTGRIANQNKEFYSYSELQSIVKKKNIKSSDEYNSFVKISKDKMIPKSPQTHFKNWKSWGHFLDYIGDGSHQWTRDYVLDFISNLRNELNTLDSIELVTIINSNNLARRIKNLGYLEELISSKAGSLKRDEIIKNIISSLDSKEEEFEENNELEPNDALINYELSEGSVEDFINDIEVDDSKELEDLKPIEQLKYFDNKYIIASLDNENVDFLLKNQLKKLWNSYLNGKFLIKDFEKEDGGKNFNQIKKWFFNEFKEINKIKLPKDYIFKYKPNDMQKLIAYRLKKEKRYGNWSGTGAGKTLAAIFSGRHLELNNTVIVCNNATVKGWLKSSQEYFSNSNVFVKSDVLDSREKLKYSFNIIDKKSFILPPNQYNYVILNYETFQLGDGDFIVSEMLKNNVIDYLILDEVQNVKQRSLKNESTRRNVINKLVIHSRERNPNLHLTAMSATPVINNLTEPKKLIELITGETHEELDVKDSIVNGIEMYKYLTRFGLRYIPKSLSLNQEIVMSDGEHLVERLIEVPKGSHIEFEKILLETKLESIKKYLKKGVLIYTYLVTDFIKEIGKFVEECGFTYGYYTGGDKTGLNRFLSLEVDILIGSAPVSTGVDGIQEVCDTLIPIVLPWTSSEYQQLLGRVNRQGSKFDKVNVFIPQVNIEMDTKTWSHDKRKLNIIEYKSSLADLAVDGEIPKSLAPSKSTLIEQAKRELRDWIKRIEEGDLITFEREELKIPLNPKVLEYQVKKLGNFSQLNKTWSISNSKTNFERIKKNPKEWYTYHSLYREARKEWDEIPYKEIAKKIKSREDWIVADLGCGENLLSKEIKNKVLAFDFIAKEGEDVIPCDISNLPLDKNIIDVAVFSLSLMGSNYEDYLKESYRILKPYGNLFIAEPKKKGERILDDLKKQLTKIGFKIVDDYYSSNFLYLDCIKN